MPIYRQSIIFSIISPTPKHGRFVNVSKGFKMAQNGQYSSCWLIVWTLVVLFWKKITFCPKNPKCSLGKWIINFCLKKSKRIQMDPKWSHLAIFSQNMAIFALLHAMVGGSKVKKRLTTRSPICGPLEKPQNLPFGTQIWP